MARLVTDGFETQISGAGLGNANPEGLEVLGNVETSTGSAISTTTGVHLSGACLKCDAEATYRRYKSFVATKDVSYFVRAYFTFEGSIEPTAQVTLIGMAVGSVRLSPAGKLRLFDQPSVQVGSDSAKLKTGQLYRIEVEVKVPTAGKGVLKLYLAEGDGAATLIAGSGEETTGNTGTQNLNVGNFSGNPGSLDVYIDDVAVNDATGEAQNTLPGIGHVVLAKPVADKSTTGFKGGGGGETKLFEAVDNTPPTGVVSPGTNASQIGSANNNSTDNYEAEVQSLTELGITGTVALAQGIARGGNSTTTSRAPGVQVKSNPEIAEATKSLGTVKAETDPTGWVTFRTAIAYSPTMTSGEKSVVRVRKANAVTDNLMFDMLGLLVEYAPITVYDDSASGTITSSGVDTESSGFSDSSSGTIASSGTAEESRQANDSPSGSIISSGTVVEQWEDGDAQSGSISLSGSAVESLSVSDTASGIFTLTAFSEEAYGFADAGSGVLALFGYIIGVLEESPTFLLLFDSATTLELADVGAALTFPPNTELVLATAPTDLVLATDDTELKVAPPDATLELDHPKTELELHG